MLHPVALDEPPVIPPAIPNPNPKDDIANTAKVSSEKVTPALPETVISEAFSSTTTDKSNKQEESLKLSPEFSSDGVNLQPQTTVVVPSSPTTTLPERVTSEAFSSNGTVKLNPPNKGQLNASTNLTPKPSLMNPSVNLKQGQSVKVPPSLAGGVRGLGETAIATPPETLKTEAFSTSSSKRPLNNQLVQNSPNLDKESDRTDSNNPPVSGTSPENKTSAEPQTFPVGLNIKDFNAIKSILIRGKEDGEKAINFENWLIPYDAVVSALKLDIKPVDENILEVRSPGLVTRIDKRNLRNDPELGLVFSIKDLQTLFGVPAEFDINEYAIKLLPPWLNLAGDNIGEVETPVVLEGLPRVNSPKASLTAIEQRTNVDKTGEFPASYRGELRAVGTIFGGSWYLRANQPRLFESKTWNIGELRYQRQTDKADYIIGSQPAFWSSQGTGDYWGVTTIQRWGFKPQVQLFGESSINQRLTASQLGRTISGKAEPGTLVRLVQGFGDRVIGEVLVDSSGIYRFDNVKEDKQSFIGNYRVLLYPQGRLSETPEVRDISLSSVSGQLPKGGTALVVSGGVRREMTSSDEFNPLGNFSDFRGGVATRWGVTEDLTVGVGGVYEDSWRGLGEIFYQPQGIPLQVAVSALTGDDESSGEINADINYRPSDKFTARFNSDRFSSRFGVDWEVAKGVTLLGSTDSRDGAVSGGLRLGFGGRNWFTSTSATYDSKDRFRWNSYNRLQQLELTSNGNEVGSRSQLSYNLSGDNLFYSTGNSLFVGYDTSKAVKDNDNLTSVGWRYRSKQRATDGVSMWETSLGYGFGSQGSGIIASLQTAAIPGILLRANYQGVGINSSDSRFGIELVSSFNTLGGIRPGDRRSDYFRTQGGLLIQPFFDKNNNSKRDKGEEIYSDRPDLLMIINNKPLKFFTTQTESDGTIVRLTPGTYRLDFDPAGFPIDWQTNTDALAIDVVAGSYTPISVPLVRAYTRSGIVTNAQGDPVGGARVEAIGSDGKRIFSVTNGAGVYYLERLQKGEYKLEINGTLAKDSTLKLEESSELFQELNLQLP
ncbi:MAG: carboxypeptidase-like regulatory domain-containing protein [Nostocaceae cyanobacterium]|nr:carboxypeptidase-like regulatory domain-containing protein [Nostocaceae cyanobacterium]